MIFLHHFVDNLFTIPILSFICGIFLSLTRFKYLFNKKLNLYLTFFLLFSIGLKGGEALIGHSGNQIFSLLCILAIWGLIQPLFSYLILKRFTKVDPSTAAAISACFGSVSVMTYIAGATFLEKLNVPFQGVIITALAIMEVPAIISALFISKIVKKSCNKSIKNLILESIFNKTILIIFSGITIGAISQVFQLTAIPSKILLFFKPFLCLFLFNMGWHIGKQREHLRQFSWSLSLFGLYMPLAGASFGILLSYLLSLDVGTGTLIAILSASASYIAVPAAMRVALPEAKEAIYLPLSLGITFPFNVIIGIPIYYELAVLFLK